MSGDRKTPKRRFKEFQGTERWTQCKLADIADVTKLAGFEFTEHVVYSKQGKIIALRGLNIKNGHLILDDVMQSVDSVIRAKFMDFVLKVLV